MDEEAIRADLSRFDEMLKDSQHQREELTRLVKLETLQDRRQDMFQSMVRRWRENPEQSVVEQTKEVDTEDDTDIFSESELTDLESLSAIPDTFDLQAIAYINTTHELVMLYRDSIESYRYILQIQGPSGFHYRVFENSGDPYQKLADKPTPDRHLDEFINGYESSPVEPEEEK